MNGMDYANVEIRLGGSLHNTVIKEVSAPEIAVLRKIHGADAVNQVVKTRTETVVNRAERERIESLYGKDVVISAFGGEFAKLPESLADVDAGEVSEPEAPVTAKSKKA